MMLFNIQASNNTTVNKSPVNLLFGNDITLPITHIEKWNNIQQYSKTLLYKTIYSIIQYCLLLFQGQ